MMQIDVFPALPAFLLEQLVPFETPHNGKDWEQLYRSTQALHAQYPLKRFTGQPYLYVDLRGQSCGLIYVEHDSGELYYVYDQQEKS